MNSNWTTSNLRRCIAASQRSPRLSGRCLEPVSNFRLGRRQQRVREPRHRRQKHPRPPRPFRHLPHRPLRSSRAHRSRGRDAARRGRLGQGRRGRGCESAGDGVRRARRRGQDGAHRQMGGRDGGKGLAGRRGGVRLVVLQPGIERTAGKLIRSLSRGGAQVLRRAGDRGGEPARQGPPPCRLRRRKARRAHPRRPRASAISTDLAARGAIEGRGLARTAQGPRAKQQRPLPRHHPLPDQGYRSLCSGRATARPCALVQRSGCAAP